MQNFAANRVDYHDLIDCLIAAIEARDPYTSGHSTRVADMTLAICEHMKITGNALDAIHMAAHMHDIGKIGIPDRILSKPDKLTEAEWAIVKLHPQFGYDILRRSTSLDAIAKIVLHHHERWDGAGYPDGLSGSAIPLGSQIIAVADSIDAMLSNRPYKTALSEQECVEQLRSGGGSQFSPTVIAAVLSDELFCEHLLHGCTPSNPTAPHAPHSAAERSMHEKAVPLDGKLS